MKPVPIESVFWIIFAGLFLISVIALVWIRRNRKPNVHDFAKDADWVHENFLKADACFKDIDPDDNGYRAVVDDKNGSIVCTSEKGAQILITPFGMYYKAPNCDVYESVVDAFFSRREGKGKDEYT